MNTKRNISFLNAMQWSGAPLRAKLATYASINGLEIQEELNPGELLRKRVFGQMLIDAIALLSPEDAAYLKTVPLVIADSAVHQGQYSGTKTVSASCTKTGDDVVITMYRKVITAQGNHERYTREQFVDWIKRLLQHEIGHARDSRSDEQMAKESNY